MLIYVNITDSESHKTKIDTHIHTQKLKFFFCILNYLIRNFQEICKIPKPKTQLLKQIENPNPDLSL